MKTFFFQLSLIFFSCSSFAQDSIGKPNKSSLQVQGGYAVYTSPQFQGQYLSLGYKYKCNKFLWYNAQFFLMEGKYKTHSAYIPYFWPNLQIKNISTGISGEYSFYKRHSIEGGAGLNFSFVTRSIGYDAQPKEIFYGLYRTINWGYYGSLSYFYRINSRFKTGLTYNKTVIRQDRFHPPYQLDMYGCVLQLTF